MLAALLVSDSLCQGAGDFRAIKVHGVVSFGVFRFVCLCIGSFRVVCKGRTQRFFAWPPATTSPAKLLGANGANATRDAFLVGEGAATARAGAGFQAIGDSSGFWVLGDLA